MVRYVIQGNEGENRVKMTKRKIEFDNSRWDEEDSSFACGGGSVRGASRYDGGGVAAG